MNVHLIDGTYELFRHFFAVPAAEDVDGQEIGAVRGVLASVLSMIWGFGTSSHDLDPGPWNTSAFMVTLFSLGAAWVTNGPGVDAGR